MPFAKEEMHDSKNLSVSRVSGDISENTASIPAIIPPDVRSNDNAVEAVNDSSPAQSVRTSRRAFMNSIVSAAALASATAVASPSDIELQAHRSENAAALARVEQIVDVLRTRYIREGWTMDEAAAELALGHFRKPVVAGPGKDDDYGWWQARDFLVEHGQSIDWVITGRLTSLISHLAAHSPRAVRLSTDDDPIFAAIEAHRAAERLCHDAYTDETSASLNEARDQTAWQLVDIRPTTLEGATTLLDYWKEATEENDQIFPEFDEERGLVDHDLYGIPFAQLLVGNAVAALFGLNRVGSCKQTHDSAPVRPNVARALGGLAV
jgi:hypothetical protein